MAQVKGRISEATFYALIAILFSIAILAAVARTTVRWRKSKRIKPDDILLILASLCLVVTAGLLFQMIPTMYFLQNLLLNPSPGFVGGAPPGGAPGAPPGMPSPSENGGPPPGMTGTPPGMTGTPPDMSSMPVELSSSFIARIERFRRMQNALTILSWITIFSVKFSFLGFFRQLVDRLRPLELYWRGIVVATAVSFCYCVSEPFFSCRESEATACGHGSARTLMLRLQAISIFLDIATDALLVSIPMRLLWRVRIKFGQKLGLGAFLSLSICMAVVSAIRMGGERYKGNYDFSWLFFWLEVEACIAVSVVSLTAFPAVFVTRTGSRPSGGGGGGGRSGGSGPPAKPWYSSSIGKIRNNREKIHSTDDITGISQHDSKWPTYPSAIASGTGRGGKPSDTTLGEDGEEEEIPLGLDAQPQGQQDVQLEKLSPRNDSMDARGLDQV